MFWVSMGPIFCQDTCKRSADQVKQLKIAEGNWPVILLQYISQYHCVQSQSWLDMYYVWWDYYMMNGIS